MTQERFSKPQAFQFGWDIWKKNIGFFALIFFVAFLVQLAPGFVSGYLKDDTPILAFFLSIFYNVISMIVSMGFIKISLKFRENQQPEIADLFSVYPLFFVFLFGSVLYGLIVLGGMILLVIPAIIWGIQFQFYAYFIIDQKAGPVEALKKSARLTRGVKFELFIFNMMVLGVNLLGIFALGVGVFITAPITMVATAYVYRRLLETQAQEPAVGKLIK